MTSRSSSHAERLGPTSLRPTATPKLQVQRSVSKETITIHFSALGKEEEEEEEELYGPSVLASSALGMEHEDQSVVTALEASEDLQFEGGLEPVASSEIAVLPVSSTTLPPVSIPQASVPHTQSSALSILPSSLHTASSSSTTSSSWPSGQKIPGCPPAPSSASSSSSPYKSVALPSIDKPFMSLVKSLSTEAEPREGLVTPPSIRHRHLMKNLVKSLSTDTSRQDQDSGSHRLPDSRLNLHLFKQFTQPRVSVTSDSKTAPSSPLTSPDSRSFFKVAEVEARIEDTKRRLSEVIYEPLQLLSKIIGDESSGGGGGHRHKALSSSASELSNLASLNGHLESNNNYSIKEEECDSEGECLPEAEVDVAETRSPKASSLALDKCSMSALARQEDEEFCELYSEDFETNTDTEAEADVPGEVARRARPVQGTEADILSDDEADVEEPAPTVPYAFLLALTALIYSYFVLPLPSYLGGLLFGAAVGFMLAIGIVWLSAPGRVSYGSERSRRKAERWKAARLDIKEPGVFKGWMNEIHSYDPETYHATLTHSVFVRLDGSTLRLSKPNRNISRRAMFNEPKPDVTYVSQKIYDLTDSKIYLVPPSLARKRVWNKKYPICIELGKQEDFMSKAEADKGVTGDEDGSGGGEEIKRPPGTQESMRLSAHKEQTLFLFGRTGREKEEWFRRILLASKLKSETKKPTSITGNKSAVLPTHSRSSSRGSLDELLASQPRQRELTSGVRHKVLLDYAVYMAQYVPTQGGSPAGSPVHSTESSPGAGKKLPSCPGPEQEPVSWVNALVGRIFWDFLGENLGIRVHKPPPVWKLPCDLVDQYTLEPRERLEALVLLGLLQASASDCAASSLPAVPCDALRLRGATPSDCSPGLFNPIRSGVRCHQGPALQFALHGCRLTAEQTNGRGSGLWFDLEISYNGSFLMTLETKMNLARLGKEGEGLRPGEPGKEGHRPRMYCLADSDEESSSAGSSDEEDPPEMSTDKNLPPGAEGFVGGHKPSKIMRFVDKITKSKYFQKATETEFIKKKMEEVSNTPLLLTVEVQECRGTLAVNIPPPPTDRIWYGFRSPPRLELKARPKLGEREVTLAHVTDWIEKKLDQEFQKIFVMPNMDDVWLPIMHSAMDTRSNITPVAVTTEVTKDPDSVEAEADPHPTSDM
ncbi:testis-expressed sequence 2 protein-like [Scleropages formosus]|uniref:Testis-expressed sequence 2 protein-like n=1 Tax=Scleropages formosus TaxID=113540 RepID=A0A0P7U1E1_SCLFO|nr:testis-expressed sequence 2 protein-like [Scleropages formosus]